MPALSAGFCVDGLRNCLEATAGEEGDQEKWHMLLRQVWLDTLLEAGMATDMMADRG